MNTITLADTCPAWCDRQHDLGYDIHHGTEIRAVNLRNLDGGDRWGLSAQLVRYDPEPGFPGATHEIAFSAGGFTVDLGAADARTIAVDLRAFAEGLLKLADQLAEEVAR